MADQVLRDMNLSSQEMQRFCKAMKDPEFMKLLSEYAQEISEPLNKEEAESYIKMVEEQSRGGFSMKGKDLVIPTPDFCVKTHDKNTNSKFFINVCHSDKIELPQNNKRVDGSGVDWHIPFSLSPIRKDKDKGGADCMDVDYVVNPEVCKRCLENKAFKKFVSETAIDSVERHYHLQLKREISFPKLKYKGPFKSPKMLTIPTSAMPSPSLGDSTMKHDVSLVEAAVAKEDYLKQGDCVDNLEHAGAQADKKLEGLQGHGKPSKKIVAGESQEPLCEPKYEIVYSNGLDLGKFWMDNNIDEGNKLETPKEILLRVLLPEVATAIEVELDVSDTHALLVVPGLYKLQVKWRFTVDSAKGTAKFDKATHKLEVVLPTLATPSGPG